MDATWRLTAREQARLVAQGDISARDLIEAHLARIGAVNSGLNAVVRVLEREARDAADQADRVKASGAALGPLHGVPFTVKENIDVAGMPTTLGVAALAEAVPPEDAPVVERMRGAGAILLGRTNLPDFALRKHTDSSLYGPTVNPWNASRTPGGSSGGEAVALATGMSAIGLGTDIGGSLRSPASACGIASLKPSRGRVPYAGHVPGEDRLAVVQQLDVVGPMARRIADVRLAFQCMMGAHPRDPLSVDVPLSGPRMTKPIRVAVVTSVPGMIIQPAVASAVRRAADALADAGYDVVEAVPPRFVEAYEATGDFLMGDFNSVLDHLLPIMGQASQTFLNGYMAVTPPFTTAPEMSQFFTRRDGIARAWSTFMADHPLVLTPTWTDIPFEVGFDIAEPDGPAKTKALIGPVMIANVLGLPSACVSAGMDEASRLPVGVLVNGQPFRDDLCLDAAEVIETKIGLAVPIDPVRPA